MGIDYTVITSSLAGLDFLGEFARAIIEGIGIIGLGIIVFTLVLRAITLPFDIYQRYKTRKQTLIMRSMKEDLDKLQKQYANDKATYNQKMTELYKKNGYSMFGACLPMLLSLVILIVAFQGFNSYSRYANVKQFVDMTESFNEAVLGHGTDGNDWHLHIEGDEDDEFTIPAAEFTLPANPADGDLVWQKEEIKEENGVSYPVSYRAVYRIVEDGQAQEDEENEEAAPAADETERMEVTSQKPGAFLHYTYLLGAYTYSEDEEGGAAGKVFTPVASEEIRRDYYIVFDAFKAYLEGEESELASSTLTAIGTKLSESGNVITQDVKDLCTGYLDEIGADAAREYYMGHKMGFLWIKNVWESDATYRHPVPTSTPDADAISGDNYARLTMKLEDQKSAYNGYYILIILSIGMMILSQFITMRSQKEANKYQTVDGQGAKTQKFMLFLMPLIFGIFAFMYSAAFSIYMIVSSFLSLVVTLLCNLILGRIFKKKEDAAIQERYGQRLAWKEEGKKPQQKGKDKTKSRK